MLKPAIFLLFIFLPCCSVNTNNLKNPDKGYFADASDCFRSSEKKLFVNVPTAGSMSVVEVPIGNDAISYGLCMEHAGHPPTQANPEDFLIVSRACSQQVRTSSSPDEDFAKCVRYGKISVEPIKSY